MAAFDKESKSDFFFFFFGGGGGEGCGKEGGCGCRHYYNWDKI